MAGLSFAPERRLHTNGELRTENVPLILTYSFKGKRLKYLPGIRLNLGVIVNNGSKITFKNWNQQKEEVPKSVTGSQLVNAKIAGWRSLVEAVELQAARAQQELTYEALKTELDRYKGKKTTAVVGIEAAKRQGSPSPLEALDLWLVDRKENEAYGSYKSYKVFRNHFSAFCAVKYKNLTFDQIDNVLYEQFRRFLRTALKHSINTEAKLVKILLRYLRHCDKMRFSTNVDFRSFKPVAEIPPDVLTLDIEELSLLETSEMPTVHLERVRDCFLFQLYCGMRFSDVEALKKSDVHGGYIKFFVSKKTKGRTEHTVALSKRALVILDKYKILKGETALPVISNQKTNDALKEVGKIAGLNRVVKKKMIYGNQAVITETPKHELLSTHMARRAFISIAISKNINESLIKATTGHEKDSRSFGRYYHVSDENKKQMIDKIFED